MDSGSRKKILPKLCRMPDAEIRNQGVYGTIENKANISPDWVSKSSTIVENMQFKQ